MFQTIQRPTATNIDPGVVHPTGVNRTQWEDLLNQNVRNTVQVPVNETSHRENLSDTFRFPMDGNENRLHLFEKRLKAIEGRNSLGLDAASLCLVPGIKIPPKFKVPNFEKYQGTTCPMIHIKAFCNKMSPYAKK